MRLRALIKMLKAIEDDGDKDVYTIEDPKEANFIVKSGYVVLNVYPDEELIKALKRDYQMARTRGSKAVDAPKPTEQQGIYIEGYIPLPSRDQLGEKIGELPQLGSPVTRTIVERMKKSDGLKGD